MSAKWRRSLAWDDRFFPSWAWPFKAVLRTFSSIPFAVVLLILVAFYGILASVPVGVIVLGLTQLFYGVTLVGLIAVLAAALILPARFLVAGPTPRFIAMMAAVLVAIGLGSLAWLRFLWPILHYDPVTHSGVRFFASFIETNQATTLRRLPGMEMSELEFYGWWPLRVILVLFVLNMVVATLRRIEFNFKNVGVLTVHTGIILIGLGSIYYNGLKREGDTLLLAGQTPAAPMPRSRSRRRVSVSACSPTRRTRLPRMATATRSPALSVTTFRSQPTSPNRSKNASSSRTRKARSEACSKRSDSGMIRCSKNSVWAKPRSNISRG